MLTKSMESLLSGVDTDVVQLIIAMILSIIAVVFLYVFILPDKKRSTLTKPLLVIHDFLKIKKLMIESILRFLYVYSVVESVIGGFVKIQFAFFSEDGFAFLEGMLVMILGPILWRIVYEALLMGVMLVKNVMEINNHLQGIEKEDGFHKTDYSDKALRILGGIGEKIQNATTVTTVNNVDRDDTTDMSKQMAENANDFETSRKEEYACPNCGKSVPGDSNFCIFCGQRISKSFSSADEDSLS